MRSSRQLRALVKPPKAPAKLKREAKYAAYIRSAAWKKLRLAVFERDGFRCTAVHRVQTVLSFLGEALPMGRPRLRRCLFVDETRTGAGLVADHTTYARFGHENLEDVRTLCRSCNALLTKQTRANWANR